jgi:hypothetical protein
MRVMGDRARCRLSFTEEQLEAAKALEKALDSPEIQLTRFVHDFSFSMMSNCPKDVSEDQYLCAQLMYLVLVDLHADHTFDPPEVISKWISKMQWVMRSTAVHQATRAVANHEDGLLG